MSGLLELMRKLLVLTLRYADHRSRRLPMNTAREGPRPLLNNGPKKTV